MALIQGRSLESIATYTIFGKLPGRGDFLYINATHPIAREFDNILAQSLDAVSSTPGWEENYDHAGPCDFFFVSQDLHHAFIGAMHPSRDSAGRRYPLVAGIITPSESISEFMPYLPLVYELFFTGLREQLISGIDNSVEMLACRHFLETQLGNSRHASADLDLAQELLTRFHQYQPATSLEALFEQRGNRGLLERALINIGFSLELSKRFNAPSTQQQISLPLPGDTAVDVFYSATWLMIYMQFSHHLRGDALSGYFISHRNGVSHLTIVPDRIPSRLTHALQGAAPDPLTVLDLDTPNPPWATHRLYAEASYLLGRELLDPQANIRRVIEFTAQLAEKIGNS